MDSELAFWKELEQKLSSLPIKRIQHWFLKLSNPRLVNLLLTEILRVQLKINYIYLNKYERHTMSQIPHQYLIEQL